MSHFSAYGAYVVFVTIRTHFESSTFDFFKHHKVKASKATYDKRPDKWFFDKVAKEYEDKDLRDFFIANRLKDRNYVTELLEDIAKDMTAFASGEGHTVQHEDLITRLEDAVAIFEVSHPDLVTTISKILEGLSNAGI